MTGMKMPRTSIRLSLVMGSILLIVGAIAVFSVGIYWAIYRPLQSDLTSLAMRRASETVADDVKTIFIRVETVARLQREWGRNGLIELDNLDRFNRQLAPFFNVPIGISSMAVAQDSGHEVLIVSLPEGRWFDRLTDPDALGKRARFLTWDENGALASSEERDVDYDARKRSWFTSVMALPSDNDLYWTPPYRFVSTGELGMSAVVRWTSAEGKKAAMTTDIKLLDVTHLAQQISVGKSGLAAVLTEDGKILGLPRDKRFMTAEAIQAASLLPVDELVVPPLTLAFQSWQTAGRPDTSIMTFYVEGTPWLASFRSIHLTNQIFWIATLAPTSDFEMLTGDTLILGAALVLGSIIIASLGAIWLGGRFSRPIEQLTNESARIGRISLAQPITVESPVREIDALARSLEGMRGNLVEARAELEGKAELELQLEQSRKLEIVGQLAAGIAHDFNNILGAILGFASFLAQDLQEGTLQHGFARRILTGGERAKDLIQQILAFSRRTGVERKPIDLKQIVRETEGLLRASLPSTTKLEVAIAADRLVAEVNEAQISQILLNLGVNASDALENEPGRVAIEISRVDPGARDHAEFRDGMDAARSGAKADGRVVFGLLDTKRTYARIRVIDSGAGIDQENLKRIFDPFFTTKARGRGTGLGLAVVHGLVLAYNGAGTVTTQRGAGSTFTIYLPLTEADPVAVAATATNLRGRERILVVDDEPDLTDMLTIGLERLGYEVVALNDPGELLAVFAEDPDAWDIVVSDQVMPNMKGLSLFQRLKAIRATILLVLCTGFSDAASEETARAAGADAFFLKPVSPEQIAAAIRRLIDNRPVADSSGALESRSS